MPPRIGFDKLDVVPPGSACYRLRMNPAEYLALLAMFVAMTVLGASRRQTTLGWPPAAWAVLICGGAGLFASQIGMPAFEQRLLALSVAIAGAGLLAPALAFAWARRQAGRGAFARAARVGRIIAAVRGSLQLHRWVELWAALGAHHAGDPAPADDLRRRLAADGDPSALMVLDGLALGTRDWQRARHSTAIDAQSRALCELGEVDAGVEAVGPLLMGRPNWNRLRRTRGMLLAPLAFAGRVDSIDALARLMRLPRAVHGIWRATAEAAAGDPDAARRTLDAAERSARTPAVASGIAARRANLPGPATLGPSAQGILQTAETEIRAGLRLRPHAPWRDWATVLIVGVIGWTFWRQIQAGSGDDPLIALQLGALQGGQWPADPLRLLTYGTLHIGWTHLLVNLLAIATLGPVISAALGRVGTLAVFTAGVVVGAIGVVLFGSPGITVGASGGAMGLLGGLVAILWLHPGIARSLTGRAGARFGLSVIVFQSVFDIAMPEISFASHGGGALGGALAAAAAISLLRVTAWRRPRPSA